MARWVWQGGDWRAGRGCQAGRCWGQGEAAWVEEPGGEGKAAGVEDAGPGRGYQVRRGCRWQGKYGEVEIVRWRWLGGRNHRMMCGEWRHLGSVKFYGKIMSLLIGPDTTFIRKGCVFANRDRHHKGIVLANRTRQYIY